MSTTTAPAADATAPNATGGVAARVWRLLGAIADPEIPVLSIVDLGIVRFVEAPPDAPVRVGLSPTYSGCPATEVIKRSVVVALRDAGLANASVTDVLSPPWTSDWISEEGRRKLAEYGIAPPAESVSSPKRLLGAPRVSCPRCGSEATECLSEFGSTPCKALYRCTECREPFDYFKCI